MSKQANANKQADASKNLFQPVQFAPVSENVSIRILPAEVEAIDQFVRSEADCESRRQLICEALEFYFGQPKEVRAEFRKQLAEANAGANPHKRKAGRPKGSRDRPKANGGKRGEASGSPVEVVQVVQNATDGPKSENRAAKPTKAPRTTQKTLKTGGNDGW